MREAYVVGLTLALGGVVVSLEERVPRAAVLARTGRALAVAALLVLEAGLYVELVWRDQSQVRRRAAAGAGGVLERRLEGQTAVTVEATGA